MNSRLVQDSLIKKLTILIFVYFNFFFELHYLQKLHGRFSAKYYSLDKASKQYNKSRGSTQNKIDLHFCSRSN